MLLYFQLVDVDASREMQCENYHIGGKLSKKMCLSAASIWVKKRQDNWAKNDGINWALNLARNWREGRGSSRTARPVGGRAFIIPNPMGEQRRGVNAGWMEGR